MPIAKAQYSFCVPIHQYVCKEGVRRHESVDTGVESVEADSQLCYNRMYGILYEYENRQIWVAESRNIHVYEDIPALYIYLSIGITDFNISI